MCAVTQTLTLDLLARARCPSAFLQDHGRLKDKGPGVPPVARVELVQKTNLWGYQGGQSRPYLKIVCALPNLVAPARGKQAALCRG